MQRTLPLFMKTVITLTVATLLLTGCSTSSIIGSWSDPGLTKGSANHILVLGVSDNEMVKRSFEDMMVIRLKEKGVLATPAYRMVNHGEKLERDVVLQFMQTNSIDSVMVTKLIDKRTETVVTPSQTSVRTGDYNSYRAGGSYNRWYPNYSASYDVTHTPSRVQNYDVLTIESTLYTVENEQERPIWSAQSETAPGGDINSDLSELIDKFVKEMSSGGVF